MKFWPKLWKLFTFPDVSPFFLHGYRTGEKQHPLCNKNLGEFHSGFLSVSLLVYNGMGYRNWKRLVFSEHITCAVGNPMLTKFQSLIKLFLFCFQENPCHDDLALSLANALLNTSDANEMRIYIRMLSNLRLSSSNLPLRKELYVLLDKVNQVSPVIYPFWVVTNPTAFSSGLALIFQKIVLGKHSFSHYNASIYLKLFGV